MNDRLRPNQCTFALLVLTITTRVVIAVGGDADHDGLPDGSDPCPAVNYAPGFNWTVCDPMDLDPNNDARPECKARERVAHMLVTDSAFITEIAFCVVKNGTVHFADAFTYVGGGQFVHNPDGIHSLYRIGSTSKSFTAAAAMILAEAGELALDDFVNDDDGTQRS